MMRYNIVRASDGDNVNLTVVHNGEMYVADETHTNWDAILRGVLADDESVIPLFDISQTVASRFENLSERVSVRNGNLFFDGDLVDNSLTRQVIRFVEEGVDDFMPLVKFFEKVQTNPSNNSREQLFRWLSERDFSITPEGDFLAYKGVKKSDEEGVYLSVHAGHAISDGVEYRNDQIPNRVGSIVEMPRSEVQDDPDVACHTGLHAGTYEYASSFVYNGALLLVEINPRDVVSVPRDSSDQKIRACRYKVIQVIENEAPLTDALYEDADEEEEVNITNLPDYLAKEYPDNSWAFQGPVDYDEDEDY